MLNLIDKMKILISNQEKTTSYRQRAVKGQIIVTDEPLTSQYESIEEAKEITTILAIGEK